MDEKTKTPKKKVKVILRPSPLSLKILLIVLILFSMGALIALRWVTNSIRQETENLREEAAAVEYENEGLKEKIDEVDSVKGVQNIAEEELHMVDPDTVIIDPKP
jgi:cell division protein FtsL